MEIVQERLVSIFKKKKKEKKNAEMYNFFLVYKTNNVLPIGSYFSHWPPLLRSLPVHKSSQPIGSLVGGDV